MHIVIVVIIIIIKLIPKTDRGQHSNAKEDHTWWNVQHSPRTSQALLKAGWKEKFMYTCNQFKFWGTYWLNSDLTSSPIEFYQIQIEPWSNFGRTRTRRSSRHITCTGLPTFNWSWYKVKAMVALSAFKCWTFSVALASLVVYFISYFPLSKLVLGKGSNYFLIF